jgi:hypothetical protein
VRHIFIIYLGWAGSLFGATSSVFTYQSETPSSTSVSHSFIYPKTPSFYSNSFNFDFTSGAGINNSESQDNTTTSQESSSDSESQDNTTTSQESSSDSESQDNTTTSQESKENSSSAAESFESFMSPGWKEREWFGWYFATNTGWLYHLNLGWIYAEADSLDSIWFFNPRFTNINRPNGKWFWTNHTLFPYFYLQRWHTESNYKTSVTYPWTWVFLDLKTDQKEKFYDYSSSSWLNLE